MKSVFEKVSQITIEAIDGYQEIAIKNCETASIDLHVGKHRHAQMFVTYIGVQADVSFTIVLEEASSLELLCWNTLDGAFTMHQQVVAKKDALAHIGYGDLEGNDGTYTIQVDLQEQGSNVQLTSACIAKNKKYKVEMNHLAPYTSGDMHHYAIVLEDGSYKMKASGIIKKGAHASVSHQATRVLTMSDQQNSEVTPILLIDENDVKASHATTLGQPDEYQLYYLQSRGLTRQQALGLLTIGYILPICEVVKHEDLKTFLQSEIEEKVIKHV